MSWNYRWYREADGSFSVYSTFYDEAGRPNSRATEPEAISGLPDQWDIHAELAKIQEAMRKPVLDLETYAEIGSIPTRAGSPSPSAAAKECGAPGPGSVAPQTPGAAPAGLPRAAPGVGGASEAPVRTADLGRAERIAALLKKRTWYIEARVGSQNHRGDLVHFIDDYRRDDGTRGYINLPAEEYVAGLLVDLADARAGAADMAEGERATKAARRKKAREWLETAPELHPCLNCGRIVLAGRCCDSPAFPPAAAPSPGPRADSKP